MTSPPRHLRILFVTEQVKPGGKRSHVETLSAGLEAIGHRTRILDWNDLAWIERALVAGPTRLLERFAPASGHHWSVPAWNHRLAAHAKDLLLRFAPDIVHVQEATSMPGVRRVAGHVPIALTVHGPLHREVASGYGVPLNSRPVRMLRDLESRAFQEADAVISVDHPHAAYVRELGRSGTTHVVPNFVDTRLFHTGVKAEPFDEATERWIGGRPILLCSRRLVPKNGVHVAIRATGLLRDAGVPIALVIVGDGPQRATLEALIAEQGSSDTVRLLGSVPGSRLPGWTVRATVAVVSSVPSQGVEEATSISVLEAQACGRVVVASRIGGIPEIVADGINGLLVPPDDPAELAAAITRALRDGPEVEALRCRAARDVVERHSHVAAAERYSAIYATLLAAVR